METPTWKVKNLGQGSGRQRQLFQPQVLPALAVFLLGKATALGRTQISCSQPTPAFSFCQAFFSWQSFRQAMRFEDCRGLHCELRRGRCQSWAPRLEPSKALVKGTPGLYFSLFPSQGSKTAGLSSSSLLTPPVDTLCSA